MNKKVMLVVLVIAAFLIVIFGINYTSAQPTCSPSSCPSGYTDQGVDCYWTSGLNYECERTCYRAGGCSTDESGWYQAAYSEGYVSPDVSVFTGWSTVNSNYCYRYYVRTVVYWPLASGRTAAAGAMPSGGSLALSGYSSSTPVSVNSPITSQSKGTSRKGEGWWFVSPSASVKADVEVTLYAKESSYISTDTTYRDCTGTAQCRYNSDCGATGYVGSNYCSAGNVVRDYTTNTCTGSYTCSSSTSAITQETCSYGCNAGYCLPSSTHGPTYASNGSTYPQSTWSSSNINNYAGCLGTSGSCSGIYYCAGSSNCSLTDYFAASGTKTVDTEGTSYFRWRAYSSTTGQYSAISTFEIKIDKTDPTLQINSGNGTFNSGGLSTNHTINFTGSDINLASCKVLYNGTNRTVSCSNNVKASYSFPLQKNVYNATVYAIDQIGNTVSSFLSWNYSTPNIEIYSPENGTIFRNNNSVYFNASIYTVEDRFYCYQETANASTSCGGLATGTYLANNSDPVFYVNYSKPTTAIDGFWQVKHGEASEGPAYFSNYTISSDCWDAYTDKLVFNFNSSAATGYCYNGTNWKNITATSSSGQSTGCGPFATSTILNVFDGSLTTAAGYMGSCFGGWDGGDVDGKLYEEAMIWDIQPEKSYAWTVANWTLNYNGTNYTHSVLNKIINVSNIFGYYNIKLWAETDLGTVAYNDSITYAMSGMLFNSQSPANNTFLNNSAVNLITDVTSFYDIDTLILKVYDDSENLINETIRAYSGLTSTTFSKLLTLPKGHYSWYLTGNDSLGDIYYSGNYTFIVDLVIPNGLLLLPNGTILNYSDVNLTANITDDYSGVDNVTINIFNPSGLINSTIYYFNGALEDVASIFINLADNFYTWFIGVVDKAGNTFTSQNNTFTVDTTKPEINVLFPGNNSAYNYHNLTLNLSITDNVAGLDTCWKQLNNGLNVTFNCLNTTVGTIDQGTTETYNNITIWANDTAGNLQEKTIYFGISTILPLINLVSPTDGSYVNLRDVKFNASVSSPNEMANCSVYINSTGAWHLNTTNSTPVTDYTVMNINLSDNSYKYNVLCYDIFGNYNSAFWNNTFIVDTTPPAISYSTGMQLNNANVSANWIYINTIQTELHFKNITYNLYKTSLVNSTSYTTKIEELNFTNLSDGYYSYNATTCDSANWCNSTETRNIKLDTSPPVVDVILPKNINYGDNLLIPLTYTVIDDLSEIEGCVYSVYNTSGTLINSEVSLPNCENTTFSVPEGDVNYYILLTSNDSLGNVNATQIPFGVRTVSPAVNLFPATNNYTNNNNVNLSFTVTTNADNITNCSLYGNFNGTWLLNQTILNPNTSIRNYFSEIYLEESEYLWNVLCYDNFDRVSDTFNSTITVDKTNPDITLILPTGNTVSEKTFTVAVSASDDKALYKCYYNITYSVGTSAETLQTEIPLCMNTQATVFFSSPTSYNLSVWAVDKAGNIDVESKEIMHVPTTSNPVNTGQGSSGTTTNPVPVNQATTWKVTTFEGGNSYIVNLLSTEKTKELYFENTGGSERLIKLSCADVEGDLCKYVTFSALSFPLKPVKDIKVKQTFSILASEADFDFDKYVFNIIAKDELNAEEFITITANTNLNPVITLGSKLTSMKRITDNLSIPYILIFILIWVITAVIVGYFLTSVKGGYAISALVGLILASIIIFFA